MKYLPPSHTYLIPEALTESDLRKEIERLEGLGNKGDLTATSAMRLRECKSALGSIRSAMQMRAF